MSRRVRAAQTRLQQIHGQRRQTDPFAAEEEIRKFFESAPASASHAIAEATAKQENDDDDVFITSSRATGTVPWPSILMLARL